MSAGNPDSPFWEECYMVAYQIDAVLSQIHEALLADDAAAILQKKSANNLQQVGCLDSGHQEVEEYELLNNRVIWHY
jgi:hypothetical protein